MDDKLRLIVTTIDRDGKELKYLIPLQDNGCVRCDVPCASPVNAALVRDFVQVPNAEGDIWLGGRPESWHRVVVDMKIDSSAVWKYPGPEDRNMNGSRADLPLQLSAAEIDRFCREFNELAGCLPGGHRNDIDVRNQHSESVVSQQSCHNGIQVEQTNTDHHPRCGE